MRKPYVPPKQSAGGQIVDSVILLVLIYVVLLLPIVFGLTAGNTVQNKPETISWETLGQNPTMVAQWEKLGFDPESAADIITTRFDYSVKPIPLILTGVVILGYFVIVLRLSDKEYRDVIAEKFD